MQLQELVDQVAAFDAAAPKEKIKLLAWWLHTHEGRELFGPVEIRGCFSKLHMDEPPALSTYISRLADAKDLIAEKGKYKLARSVRSELDKKYGIHPSMQVVSKLLADLPDRVPDIAEKIFLSEARLLSRARLPRLHRYDVESRLRPLAQLDFKRPSTARSFQRSHHKEIPEACRGTHQDLRRFFR